MITKRKWAALLCLVFLTQACNNTLKNAYYDKEVRNWASQSIAADQPLLQTLFLVGNIGSLNLLQNRSPTLQILQKDLEKADDNSTLIFLGNNIAPKGLRAKKSDDRASGEAQLEKQFQAISNFKGQTFYIPGHLDWKAGQKKGLKAVKRQENFIEKHFNRNLPDEDDWNNYFLPDDGCGDPIKVKLHKDIVLVFIDSQWWLQDWKKGIRNQ